MKILAALVALSAGTSAFITARVDAEPLPAPCSVRPHAVASVGPCFGSRGTRLAVHIYRQRSGPFAALLFKPPDLAGMPDPVITPLHGNGKLLTAEAPADLCRAGNNSRWQLWLLGRYAKPLGRIGDFTIVGCP